MSKVEIIRDYETMKSGIKDLETGKTIIPCHYQVNMFTMVSDVEELVEGIYILKNKNLRKDVILGVYFKNGDYLLPIFDCEMTLHRYTDFNVLFTHLFENKEHSSAIIFDNNGKFLTHAKIHKITEYNKEAIDELGILTDRENVYLIDGDFYTYDKIKYPFASQENNTYPFTKLREKIISKVDSDFGQKTIVADSIAELDYKSEIMEDKMKDTYNNSTYLRGKYPKLKVKIK